MTTTAHADHEHPQYVTRADLEALEGRLINRIAEAELRISRDVNTAFWRQVLALGTILVAFGIGLYNLGITLLARLPPT